MLSWAPGHFPLVQSKWLLTEMEYFLSPLSITHCDNVISKAHTLCDSQGGRQDASRLGLDGGPLPPSLQPRPGGAAGGGSWLSSRSLLFLEDFHLGFYYWVVLWASHYFPNISKTFWDVAVQPNKHTVLLAHEGRLGGADCPPGKHFSASSFVPLRPVWMG